MGRVTVRRPVRKLTPNGDRRRLDTLAAEEPLEIRISGTPLAVTMRTPGHDVELAHGFLLSEGVIGAKDDVTLARYCDSVDDTGRNTYNVLDLTLADGVCGKAALDAVRLKSRFAPGDSTFTISPTVLSTLPDALRQQQRVFAATGGLHAAALFTSDGTLLAVREDVGRHNAVDKLLGWALLANRVPAAPSSLAVELAEDNGMTLVGFLRGESMNVYTGNGIE